MKLFNERGYIFIAFALMLPLFILFMSLVLELGRGFSRQTELQNIADAAALAGAMQIEDKNEFILVSDCPEDAEKENTQTSVDTATDKSIQINVENSKIKKNVETVKKELRKFDSDYYYCVEIRDHVPLELARIFLPDSFMPDGLPVSVLAWAKAENNQENIFNQLYKIGWYQTAQLMTHIRDGGGDSNRAEKIAGTDGIHYNYSVDEQGNVSMSRTETVDTRDVKTWKYMFVDFQPDIQMRTDQGINIDGVWNFPFENWDITSTLSDAELSKLQYASVLNLDTNSGRGASSRSNLINKLKSVYGMTDTEAVQMLSTRIENIVLFNDLHKVRGSTVKDLKEWEDGKKGKSGLPANEKKIADYTGNEALAQLVARNFKGKIAASDPLLVRIESEDMRRIHSYSNANLFYASSVRKLTLKIEVDNTASENRPLVIFYYGPQDIDENVGAGRESEPVTLELNTNFKGILFAPYSPIIIKGNGHRLQGLVIGKSFLHNGSIVTSPASSIYTDFNCSSVQFDDFDLLDIPDGFKTDEHVFMTSNQAQIVK